MGRGSGRTSGRVKRMHFGLPPQRLELAKRSRRGASDCPARYRGQQHDRGRPRRGNRHFVRAGVSAGALAGVLAFGASGGGPLEWLGGMAVGALLAFPVALRLFGAR